jgi:hypothetical protein
MKEYLLHLLTSSPSAVERRLLVREYLQARILEGLLERGAFRKMAFLGGTALRFLYRLPRFSEDLDFSTLKPEPGFQFQDTAEGIRRKLEAEGYAVSVKSKTGTVASFLLRFPGLLRELGLSAHPDETITIRVETDTNPPAGARTRTTLVRRHVLLNLLHHDPESLLSGKLHAILNRRYTKGRDLYDLVWFLTDPSWPQPNVELLNNALAQTGWSGQPMEASTWRGVVVKRLERLNWAIAAKDVAPFLERPEESRLLTLAHLRQLLGG